MTRSRRNWCRTLGASLTLSLVFALVHAGCDEGGATAVSPAPARPGAAPRAGPAPAPAAVAGPTTRPASPAIPRTPARPAFAVLLVDGRMVQFPPARVRLTGGKHGRLTAHLYSDERTTDPAYSGNSFYFEVPLEAKDPSAVGAVEYWFKARTSEAAETHNGIFLDGLRTHLQPHDVVVTIRQPRGGGGAVAGLEAAVIGNFLVMDLEGATPQRQIVPVSGTLAATIEEGGKGGRGEREDAD